MNGVHKAQLTLLFDCIAAVKNQQSSCRATEMSGPASMTPAVTELIDDVHAHSDR